MRIALTTISSSARIRRSVIVTCALGALCGAAAANSPSTPSALAAATPQRNALKLETLGAKISGEDFVRAITTQHRPLIDLFLAAPIDVNARDQHQCTPLLAACAHADWPLGERLLNKGADPSAADEAGRTPLMMAALHGSLPMFRALVARGAPAAVADAQGHTALHYAVAARQKSFVLETLDTISNLAAPCCVGGCLLTHALQTNDWQLIEPILARHPGGLRWSSVTRAHLAAAIHKRDAQRVQLLLAKHATPPTPEGSTEPLLAWAVARNDLDLGRFLLECGADPNAMLE
ncbi:MAG TPA: ankyrin repeat domain-containing protein, partial [Chthoniobacteraceae bacterium]|nr:ankyrin repeat domain-containing protein [Chthoniobacteraceae bacterium]